MSEPQGPHEAHPRGRHARVGGALGDGDAVLAHSTGAVLAETVALLEAAAATAQRAERDEDLMLLAVVAGREAAQGADLLRRHLPAAAALPAAPAPSAWSDTLEAAADRIDALIARDLCWPGKVLDLCFAMYHVRTAARAFKAWPAIEEAGVR